MRAMVVAEPGKGLALEERAVPEPQAGWVRVKVYACGVCHGDVAVWRGEYPYTTFATYPRVPGHEVAGVIDAVGEGVVTPALGDRVGVQWLFDSCGNCRSCKRGDQVYCKDNGATGVNRDGGFQDYMVAPASAVRELSDAIPFEEAGPLMCAGITMFAGLREGNYRAGDRVAVIGLGGLGHMGVLYAAAMGARVAVISSHDAKEDEARQLGAELFIDAAKDDVTGRLQEWGGADVILNTAPSAKAVSQAFPGLAQRGTCVVLGASPDTIEVKPGALLNGARKLTGSTLGDPEDMQRCLDFAAHNGIHPTLTRFKLEDAESALQAHLDGKLKGRAVILME